MSLNCEILPYLQQYIKNTKDNWNYITPTEFYKKFFSIPSKKEKFIIIDLRKKEDYNIFHIPNSVNIFWLKLLHRKNIKKLLNFVSQGKQIFLICYVGHTSSQAMTILKLLGINVVSIKFGYGISPLKNIPIKGWLQYNYPILYKK
jgi:rhodanese-related sulfurtransferase